MLTGSNMIRLLHVCNQTFDRIREVETSLMVISLIQTFARTSEMITLCPGRVINIMLPSYYDIKARPLV